MKEHSLIASIISASKWYAQHGTSQYQGANLNTYDRAADTLTCRREYAQHILQEIGDEPGKTLEIAAGTGLISESVSKQIPAVIFTDYASGPMKLLASRIQSGDAMQANFYALPFAASSFDTVFNVGGYRYVDFQGRQTFWTELGRVLKPGGRVIIGQFYPRGKALTGSNIKTDLCSLLELAPCFELEKSSTYHAKVGPKHFSVRSGTYQTFTFRKKDS